MRIFIMRHIPNFITSLNLASGFISIIFILNGDIITASWLIILAMIFDFLDGFAARALKAYSDIGKELDSLADVVSFGVAPGLIIYHLLYAALRPENQTVFCISEITSLLFLIIPAIMPVCAAIRLAIFNLDTTQSTSFKGLPTPANGLAIVSVVLGGYYSGSGLLTSFMATPILLIILSLSLSILMVTRIPLLSLKFKSFGLKGNEGRYILVVVCAAMISIFGIGSIPLIIPVYIIVSLFSRLF
jgi:CDP-diacylglycerol--serine O-phosphatidyltransferase